MGGIGSALMSKDRTRTHKKRSFTEELTKQQVLEIDACTQCGECLRHCPVQEVGGDLAISPPEKIRIFREFITTTEGLKNRLFGRDVDQKLLEDFTKAVFECTTCGSCSQNCPVGIFTQRLWPILRKEMVKRGFGPLGQQAEMPAVIEKTGNPYNKPPEQRFSPWLPEGMEISERAEIGYYAGCTGSYEAHPMVRGDVIVLSSIGSPFTLLPPEEEVCCGFPLFITGQHDTLEKLVKRLVRAYQERGVKTLLCSCPCCVNIMVRDWPVFFGGELPFRIRHITQFVSDALRKGSLVINKELDQRVIYHDPCYLSRGVGIMEEPRGILKSIPGITLLEFDRHGLDSRCCGAGGAARKVFEENAIAMGRITIDEAVSKKADKLILSCPACYEKVNHAMKGYDKQIQIVDIMELLAVLTEGHQP
jgi:heterodisulfide reductase subunit D